MLELGVLGGLDGVHLRHVVLGRVQPLHRRSRAHLGVKRRVSSGLKVHSQIFHFREPIII